MKIIDIHAHLEVEEYKNDLPLLVEKWKKSNVAIVIANGANQKSNEAVLDLANKYNIIKAALGFHPVHINEIKDSDIPKIIAFITSNKSKIIALGEIGLDYKDPSWNKSRQLKMFKEFIQLGEKLNIPLIVHSRKAELDVIELLESSKLKKIVMHYFCGRQHLVKRIINNNWYLSIPTNIVKLQQLQDNVNLCPINQLLTETDSPYLSPFPNINRNEPIFIKESLKKIAETKKLSIEKTSDIIYQNYKNLFEK